MKELFVRSLSGFFFVAILLGSLIAHELSFLIILLIILSFSLNEFYNLLYKMKFHPYKPVGIITGVSLFIINYGVAAGMLEKDFLFLNLFLPVLFPVFPLFYSPKNFSQSWISTLSGWIYVVVPLSLLPFLVFRAGTYKPHLILALFIIIWSYDSFAYLSGSLLGKHRMFPSISPKKSWEGFIGGLILTLLAANLLALFFHQYNSLQWTVFSLMIVFSANLGDFLESALKRNAGVKDSGFLMPGHGGFLDRFDSFLFSVPFVFLFTKLIPFI